MAAELMDDAAREEARARGYLARARWLVELRGVHSPSWVAHALGVSHEAVEQLRQRHALLAVRIDGAWWYPSRLFDERDQPLAGLADLLAAMHVDDPWARVQELLSPLRTESAETVLARLERDGVRAVAELTQQVGVTGLE